jgi:hypothetical protein
MGYNIPYAEKQWRGRRRTQENQVVGVSYIDIEDE